MQEQRRLAVTLAALSLIACAAACDDTDNPDMTFVDSGPGVDSGQLGSGAQDASNAQDASKDSATSDAASSSNDAAADAGTDAGTDAGQDAGQSSGNVFLSIAGGSVSALDGGTSMAKGAALLVRTADGRSLVSLQVSGLDAGTMYPAHVHDQPCATNAGGHYMHDKDAGADAGQANEVWPSLMTDNAGQARAFVEVMKVLRDDAKSIVVHATDANKTKMLCADLVVKTPYTTMGSAMKLPAANDAGVAEISASATLTRGLDGGTEASIDVQKLKPNTPYMVHVHDQPCAFGNGGGHYKFDYGVDAAVESNEIWLNFTSDDAGVGKKSIAVPHSSRAEAQAIVIHAMDNSRLACIDLKL